MISNKVKKEYTVVFSMELGHSMSFPQKTDFQHDMWHVNVICIQIFIVINSTVFICCVSLILISPEGSSAAVCGSPPQ